jgi:transcription elongation GreA/GreB family factor
MKLIFRAMRDAVDKRGKPRVKMRAGFPRCQTKTGERAFTKVFSLVNKSVLRTAILQQLQEELARQANAAATSRDEAISEESRAENKWDTHSQEAAYLAEGQARLAAEIGESINFYATAPLPDFGAGDAIAMGAVVAVAPEGTAAKAGAEAWYFLGPRAGGLDLMVEGRHILLLTAQSPLGRQLLGKRVGDTVQAAGRGRAATLRVTAVE